MFIKYVRNIYVRNIFICLMVDLQKSYDVFATIATKMRAYRNVLNTEEKNII